MSFRQICLGTVFLLIAFIPVTSPLASNLRTIYSFRGGNDGTEPQSALIRGGNGDFYGTTFGGGAVCGGDYCGTVFELTPSGQESVVYAFEGGTDGVSPSAGLVMDGAGNFYGTTLLGGGTGGCSDGKTNGCGTVFEITPGGTETVLYRFTGGSDGSEPASTLVFDRKGNLFGTTRYGGANGDGTVFRLAPNGAETVLHSFTNGGDGGSPAGGLVQDRAGNFYGTTSVGGSSENGVMFKIANNGKETVLYNFCSQANCADGGQPGGSLLADKAGNFYGTASTGGTAGWGAVFKLASNGTETVIYSFQGGSDGSGPSGGVIPDGKGNLYGTTYLGGTSDDGTIFAIAPDGSEQVLYEFDGGVGGANPSAALLLDKENLYGTTALGGANSDGSVFKVRK